MLPERPEMRMSLLFPVACCLTTLIFAGVASAQSTYGTITGTVTDASGGIMPGVDVTVANEKSGETFTRRTDNAGIYNVGTLIPGTYEIKVQPQGFRPIDVKGIVLQVNQTHASICILKSGRPPKPLP